MKKIYDAYKNNENIVFLAVQTTFEGRTTNTKDKLVPTQVKYDLPVPMGHDASSHSSTYPIPKTMFDYRSGGTPWVVIIGRDGKVAYNNFHIKKEDAIKLINNLINMEWFYETDR